VTKAKKTNKSLHRTRHHDIHYKVMDLVHKNSDITQRELAKKLGISLGSIHYCLKALVHKGWIKAGNFKHNPNKSRYLYLLTPVGITRKSNLAIDFLRRKKEEYQKLKFEIDELTESLDKKS
jgi:MarR family transcriptional regulator, temperature-dependent positive regulator of motility